MSGTLNGFAVLDATVHMPRVGAWTAEVTIEGDRVADLTAPLVLTLGGVPFSGAAWAPPKAFAGRTGLRLVGGRGGLSTVLPAAPYLGCALSLPAGEILTAAGETLAANSPSAVLGTHLARWSRNRGPAGTALGLLTESVGASWRVLSDGTVWLGTETWPAAGDAPELDRDSVADSAEFAADVPSLRPGTTLGGRRIDAVTHRMSAGALRTTVQFESRTATGFGRARASIEALVRRLLAPTLYLGTYSGTVVSQDANGRVDVKLDDARIPSPTGVQIVHGLPGVTVEGAAGKRIHVAFRDGNPTKPYAVGWDEGGTAKLGSLLVVQNGSTLAVIGVTWFAAGAAGDIAAAAALAAALGSGNIAHLVPVTAGIVAV